MRDSTRRPTWRQISLFLFLPLVAACAAASPAAQPQAAASAPTPGATPKGASFARLELVYAKMDVRSRDSRFLNITVRNPYPEEVIGARVILRILTSNDKDGLEIARMQHEFPNVIKPGDTALLEIELPKQGYDPQTGKMVQASAILLGKKAMPFPPEWVRKNARPAN